MNEPNEVPTPPPTGDATIDDALRGLADLASAPLSDHHDRLAKAHEADALAEGAFRLYERFRPQIEPGKRGWGQKGTLDLDLIRKLSRR